MNRENKRKQYEKGYYKTHACEESQRGAEDPLSAFPVIHGQLFRHQLGDGVGDTHRRDGQQHGIELESGGTVAVADITEAGDVDDDQIIDQTEDFDEELTAQNGSHIIHKGIFSLFHEKTASGSKMIGN